MSRLSTPPVDKLLTVFNTAWQRVPAYGTLLKESGICPSEVKTIGDFERLPILDKHKTFQRFSMHELCLDGKLCKTNWVLTSSGQSGIFSFGLYDPPGAADYKQRIDEALDAIFNVRTRSTLLLNCLPMGVKLYSEFCTLGETSVRSDMACGLMKTFSPYYDQVIIVGEPAFVKHLLETGIQRGIDWKTPLVHVILGEELVAENARKYIEGILGIKTGAAETGIVGASMGVGELGLNMFFEVPPIGQIVLLRRALHENRRLRREVLGFDASTVPALFAYDPDRCYVEFIKGKLVITMLDPSRPVPMVRYTTDDDGDFLHLPENLRGLLQAEGVDYDALRKLPMVMITGRGYFAAAGSGKVYPEEVKEGIYHYPELAGLTTANFRLIPGKKKVEVRIQLQSDVEPSDKIQEAFAEAISLYVTCPVQVTCHPYASFVSGMGVDYERKNDYLKP